MEIKPKIKGKQKPEYFNLDSKKLEHYKSLTYPQSSIAKLMYMSYDFDFTEDEEDFEEITFFSKFPKKEVQFKDNSKIFDNEETISLQGDATVSNVSVMVQLAKAKNWKQVVFTGSNDFLLKAWAEAKQHGLDVEFSTDEHKDLYDKHFQSSDDTELPTRDINREIKKGLGLSK